MRRGLLLALAVLAGSQSAEAIASLRAVEQAYELARPDVQLPGSPDGLLTLRPCAGCRPLALRVTPATAWFTQPGRRAPDGQAAVLTAFRLAAGTPGTLVYVYYEPQTRRVKRVVLDVPARKARP